MPRVAAMSPRRLSAGALLAGCLVLALLRPVSAPPGSPLLDGPPTLRLLPDGSPWGDHAQLADPAALVTPPVRSGAGLADASAAEASPFSPVSPDLRSNPGTELRISLSSAEDRIHKGDGNGDELPQPLETLGTRAPQALPLPRTPLLRAFSLDGRTIIEKPAPFDFYKDLKINVLKNFSLIEIGLGIDAFGLQAPPVLLVSSGDAALDKAVLRWAGDQPWASWLPPGGYRVEFAP
jgi:hypothetical protein